jgi:hypothetical protein
MSIHSTRSNEDLTRIKEADLFKTPPDTIRRTKTKKPVSRASSTSDTNREPEEQKYESPLGRFANITPKPATMADQEDQVAQDKIRRLQREDSVDPEQERVRQHEIQLKQLEQEAKIRAMQHELEMAKLQLQIEQAKAGNTTPAAINITQREDKVASFKKEVVAKSLKTSFKLEGSTNYESWRDEALTQALAIKAKHILINKEVDCPATITDDDEKKIWEVKSEMLFDILLAGVKPAIRQTIKARIIEDNKNAAELWAAIETEYRLHAADTRMELMHKFATVTIEDNNIQQYISQFRDICGKLKHMGFEIPQWQQNDRFIDGLKDHQAAFVRSKRDDCRDPKNKATITELDLNELMDQLIARAMDHKDKQKPAQAFKAEDKPNEDPDDKNKPDTSRPSTRGSRRGRGGHNQQDRGQPCGYCGRFWHDEQDCKMKNYADQSEEWQIINASAIEYFKKKNEGKLASSTPATPSTPTSMANPNVGYTAMAFSAMTPSPKDLSTKTDDMTHVIPRNIAVPDPIPWAVEAKAVGAAIKKKKDLNSLPSRANAPKTRCGRSGKQSLVDPVVLLARDLKKSTNQNETSSEDEMDRLGEG